MKERPTNDGIIREIHLNHENLLQHATSQVGPNSH